MLLLLCRFSDVDNNTPFNHCVFAWCSTNVGDSQKAFTIAMSSQYAFLDMHLGYIIGSHTHYTRTHSRSVYTILTIMPSPNRIHQAHLHYIYRVRMNSSTRSERKSVFSNIIMFFNGFDIETCYCCSRNFTLCIKQYTYSERERETV